MSGPSLWHDLWAFVCKLIWPPQSLLDCHLGQHRAVPARRTGCSGGARAAQGAAAPGSPDRIPPKQCGRCGRASVQSQEPDRGGRHASAPGRRPGFSRHRRIWRGRHRRPAVLSGRPRTDCCPPSQPQKAIRSRRIPDRPESRSRSSIGRKIRLARLAHGSRYSAVETADPEPLWRHLRSWKLI